MKTLIVYGTRYGATAGTSEEIARVLREEGFDVTVVDANITKIKTIADYEFIIVGNGMKFTGWTKGPKRFLKQFAQELKTKKLAVFVSSAAQVIHAFKHDEAEKERAWTKYLVEEVEKHELKPIAMKIFGGWVNMETMGMLDRRMGKFLVPELEAAGIKEVNGVWDTRDWDTIRRWAKELADMVRT